MDADSNGNFEAEPLMRELVLRLRYTFGSQLCYVGTTTQDRESIGDIDILIVLSQMSDAHIRHVWNIIFELRVKWNIILDCRIIASKDVLTYPLLEAYLLKRFLRDFHNKNPFMLREISSDELRDECRDRIEQQEQRILGLVPRIVADSSRLREIGQSVFDAVRALLTEWTLRQTQKVVGVFVIGLCL